VERQVQTIAQRSILSLNLTQGSSDLRRISEIAQRDGPDFNLAYIPETFSALHRKISIAP